MINDNKVSKSHDFLYAFYLKHRSYNQRFRSFHIHSITYLFVCVDQVNEDKTCGLICMHVLKMCGLICMHLIARKVILGYFIVAPCAVKINAIILEGTSYQAIFYDSKYFVDKVCMMRCYSPNICVIVFMF